MKLAVVGGGSTYTPELVDGIARLSGDVAVEELVLVDPDDVVEVPAHIDGGGVAPLAGGTLPRSARGLVTQVKEYEREVVSAAVTGDAERAALALALHPLVPGVTVAREMMSEYRERHGPDLAYLH